MWCELVSKTDIQFYPKYTLCNSGMKLVRIQIRLYAVHVVEDCTYIYYCIYYKNPQLVILTNDFRAPKWPFENYEQANKYHYEIKNRQRGVSLVWYNTMYVSIILYFSSLIESIYGSVRLSCYLKHPITHEYTIHYIIRRLYYLIL